MTLEEFKNAYTLIDGAVLSLCLEYDSSVLQNDDRIILRVKGRKFLPQGKFETAIFSLEFHRLKEFIYYEEFDSKTISHWTLVKTSLDQFYLALDPAQEDNPSERDNMVVQSQYLFFTDSLGVQHQLK